MDTQLTKRDKRGRFAKGNVSWTKINGHCEETKKLLSRMKLGKKLNTTNKKLSEEHKRKIRLFLKGRRHTEETKKRISNKLKGCKPWNAGKKMPLKFRLELRERNLGSKSHLWKGGITPINRAIRGSLQYRIWRDSVFKRDGYTCIWCGVKNGNGKTVVLNADHIEPFAFFPEKRFLLSNGRTLCAACHKKTETHSKRSQINATGREEVWQSVLHSAIRRHESGSNVDG